MKINRFLLFLFLLCLFANFAYSQSGPAKGRGRVRGTVKDQSGQPIEGVIVHFEQKSLGAEFDVKTDKKGQWTANGIAGGTWNIDFKKEGFGTKQISSDIATNEF